MRVALEWLREFVPLAPGLDPHELVERLTLAGLSVDGTSGQGDDLILDLDIASNRPDCLSHEGVAREWAAIADCPLLPPSRWTALREAGPPAAESVRVTNLVPAACGRYNARVLERVNGIEAPAVVISRLQRLGQRSIHPVADLTNYVLLEMGQPTHAFDLDTLQGGEIRVRFARAGEVLVTLDDVVRRLDPDDLVIADAERPVALAGVLGGAATAVTAATRRVLLEGAWFDPLTVRRTARRHGLRTEASHRFERGADPESAPRALDRIAAAAEEMGALVRAGQVEAVGERPQTALIPLRAQLIERLLGIGIDPAHVRAILARLGFRHHPAGDEIGRFTVPSWRADVSREVDLVEEVARIYGFNRLPVRLPAIRMGAAPPAAQTLRDTVRRQLSARGYAEAVTLSFAAEAECEPFAPGFVPVTVRNPISEEAAILRTSPLPAMLHLLRNNLSRGVPAPRLFEIGRCYEMLPEGPVERLVLSLGASGLAEPPHWRPAGAPAARAYDVFDLKGDIEALFDIFNLDGVVFAPLKPAGALHPGRAGAALLEGTEIARFGQLHPEMADTWKVPSGTWLARIEFAALLKAGARELHYRPPSRFPVSERDFSFVFPEPGGDPGGLGIGVSWQAITAALASPPIPDLLRVEPIEIYRGDNIEPGHYSLLLRVRWQSDERTLREAEVQAAADEVIARLQKLGGRQR